MPFSLVAPGWPGVVGPSGGAAPYSLEFQQFLNRLMPFPDAAHVAAQRAFIDGCVADATWPLIDDVKLVANATSSAALTNMKSASYGGSLVIDPAPPNFTANRGILGTGILCCMGTGFIPANGVNYTRDGAFIAGWSLTPNPINTSFLINASGTGVVSIVPRWSDGKAYNQINGNGTDAAPTAGADSSGLFFLERTASNATQLFRNNVSLGTSTVASAALINEMILGGLKHRIAFWAAGNFSGDAAKRTAFFGRVQTLVSAMVAI